MKSLALAAGLVVAFVALTATTAAATELINGSGEMIASGSAIDAEAEGTTTLHPPIGDIECKVKCYGENHEHRRLDGNSQRKH